MDRILPDQERCFAKVVGSSAYTDLHPANYMYEPGRLGAEQPPRP